MKKKSIRTLEKVPTPKESDTILNRLRQVRQTLDYEILVCKEEIREREIKMSLYNARSRKYINAKIEKEKFESAITQYLDCKKDLYEGVKYILSYYNVRDSGLILDCVLDAKPFNELQEKYGKTYEEVMEILNSFTRSLVKRFRNIYHNEYFPL